MRTAPAAFALIQRQSEMLDLYHEAYAAHHGEHGPEGCPCCAEFKPRIARATVALQDAIEEWRRNG